MQLFIAQIPTSIRYNELYDHFSKFGKVDELRLKDSYGFLRYELDSVAEKALEEKHVIAGFNIHVEAASNDRRGDTFRSRSPYRSRGSRYRGESPERRGGSPGSAPQWPRKRYRSPTSDRRRSPCDYCDRCERHGRYRRDYRDDFPKREKRAFDYAGHPNNRMKIVLDNIGENVGQRDLVEFLRQYNFEPTFTRITANGSHGIVEFATMEEKEEALSKLNGADFMGRVVTVRPYFQREAGIGREYRPRRFQRDGDQPNGMYDDIKTGDDVLKHQGEVERPRNGSWADKKSEGTNAEDY
jgi:RNA recognition motif-containing protein